jgi:hypothetical protein
MTEDEYDEMIAELCHQVSQNLNRLAVSLGLAVRFWYVAVVDRQVIKVHADPSRLPLFSRKSIVPGRAHA